jgi:uncharacterized Zn-binding protein involved in type VI secretion
MAAKARVTDTISHGGPIVSGSPNVLCNGLAVARLGDEVICAIHGQQSITSGSSDVLTNGIPTARVGDSISCGATIVSGSPDTIIE